MVTANFAITTPAPLDMAFHYGTKINVKFNGQFSLRIGSAVCNSDCTLVVPCGISVVAELAAPHPPVVIDGCRLVFGSTCSLQTEPGNRTVRAVRVADLMVGLSRKQTRGDEIFESGFE